MALGALHRLHARPSRRGATSLVALAILIPLAALTFALLQVGVSQNREHARRVHDEQALFLAEAGLDEALAALREGRSGDVGTQAAPAVLGGGLLWVEADQMANQLLRLRSTGAYESGRACVDRLVFRFADTLFRSALFSSQSLTIGSQAMVDSFDSAAGPYAGQIAGSHALDGSIVESNGDVTIDPSVEIWGDVHAGPDGTVSIANSGSVSGSLQPLPETRPLPAVSVPALPSLGDLAVGGSQTIPPGAWRYDAVEVGTEADLTIQGPATVVLEDWSIRSNADLVIDSALGPVEVYVTGDVDLASNSSIVTTSNSAADVTLYLAGGPGQTADLRSNSEFHGAIYAPEGTVTLNSNFELFGAAVADELLVDANARVHFDEALTTSVATFTFVTDSWSRVEVPVPALRTGRGDPFAILGVDRELLDPPADARL